MIAFYQAPMMNLVLMLMMNLVLMLMMNLVLVSKTLLKCQRRSFFGQQNT
jgi:hypothetical protein